MSDADVSAGLVLPYAAVALLGPGGAVCTLLIVFMVQMIQKELGLKQKKMVLTQLISSYT